MRLLILSCRPLTLCVGTVLGHQATPCFRGNQAALLWRRARFLGFFGPGLG